MQKLTAERSTLAQVAVKAIRRQGANNDDALRQALKVCPPDVQKNFLKNNNIYREVNGNSKSGWSFNTTMSYSCTELPMNSSQELPWWFVHGLTMEQSPASLLRDVIWVHIICYSWWVLERSCLSPVLNYISDQRRCWWPPLSYVLSPYWGASHSNQLPKCTHNPLCMVTSLEWVYFSLYCLLPASDKADSRTFLFVHKKELRLPISAFPWYLQSTIQHLIPWLGLRDGQRRSLSLILGIFRIYFHCKVTCTRSAPSCFTWVWHSALQLRPTPSSRFYRVLYPIIDCRTTKWLGRLSEAKNLPAQRIRRLVTDIGTLSNSVGCRLNGDSIVRLPMTPMTFCNTSYFTPSLQRNRWLAVNLCRST